MKIALLGYGKMGREIEKIALQNGHEIVLKINADNLHDLTSDSIKSAEVAIEFSTPETVISNIELCAQAGVPIVVGTTAWYHDFARIKDLVTHKNGALFYASNFSIGVNLFFKMNEIMAQLMNGHGYDVSIDEIHHTQKLDAPSGTAITAAERILLNHDVKKTWTNKIVTQEGLERENKAASSDLEIRSIREEAVPGTHTTYYDSEVDTISISHIAHSRIGFAKGAVQAAEWIVGKRGVFTMKDMLDI